MSLLSHQMTESTNGSALAVGAKVLALKMSYAAEVTEEHTQCDLMSFVRKAWDEIPNVGVEIYS